MPRGKPIETPTAHRATPMRMIQGFPASMNSAIPMTPRAVVRRTVRTRPRRSTTGPANSRVSPSQAAKTVKNSAAMAALWPWSLCVASVSQLLAEPSPSSQPSMTTPISSSRQSSQPRSHWRNLRRPVLRRPRGRPVLPGRDPGRHPERGRHDDDRLADELRGRGDAERRAGRADPRPDGGADRPGGVHARQQGAPGGPLDGRALDVDEHVERADARPGDHQGDRHQRDRLDDERERHDA